MVAWDAANVSSAESDTCSLIPARPAKCPNCDVLLSWAREHKVMREKLMAMDDGNEDHLP
jgi:hypothetical protein